MNASVIVGGGIAGLCAAVYAQQCGYQAAVLEMSPSAGGLAKSWRRNGYTKPDRLREELMPKAASVVRP